MKNELAVIILTWNDFNNTIDCLKSILNQNYKIFYSRNSKNLGCGYGHNTGYKIAINNNFDLVARIDNDNVY